MRTNRCRQLRFALTAYVDNEGSTDERRSVDDHLRQCAACRARVSREEAVREQLRRWSAEAHVNGAPPPWLAGSETRNHRLVGTLLRIAAVSAATVAVVSVMSSRWFDAGVPLSARGQIGDSRCAGGHAHASAEMRTLSDHDCVNRCVLMGAHYVFISQGVVYAIRNQDFVDLTRFAGQDVQIEGEVQQNVLTVSHVRPLTVSRLSNERVSQKVRVS
jgi:hypothetical protein